MAQSSGAACSLCRSAGALAGATGGGAGGEGEHAVYQDAMRSSHGGGSGGGGGGGGGGGANLTIDYTSRASYIRMR